MMHPTKAGQTKDQADTIWVSNSQKSHQHLQHLQRLVDQIRQLVFTINNQLRWAKPAKKANLTCKVQFSIVGKSTCQIIIKSASKLILNRASCQNWSKMTKNYQKWKILYYRISKELMKSTSTARPYPPIHSYQWMIWMRCADTGK